MHGLKRVPTSVLVSPLLNNWLIATKTWIIVLVACHPLPRACAGIRAHFRKPHSHSCGYLSFLDRFWSHKKTTLFFNNMGTLCLVLPSTHASKSIEHAAIYHVTCRHFGVSPAWARVNGRVIHVRVRFFRVTRVGAGKWRLRVINGAVEKCHPRGRG